MLKHRTAQTLCFIGDTLVTTSPAITPTNICAFPSSGGQVTRPDLPSPVRFKSSITLLKSRIVRSLHSPKHGTLPKSVSTIQLSAVVLGFVQARCGISDSP